MATGDEVTLPAGYSLEAKSKSTLPPGYALETPPPAAAPKKPETFLGNVKALFNPPAALSKGNEFSEGAGAYTLLGTKIPVRETMNTAAQLAGPLVGMGDSQMGMPRVNLGSIGVPENLGSKVLSGARNLRLTPKPEPETIPAQSLTESPNYPQILAGRALARQEARATLMPKKLAAPEPSPVGTPTNVASTFNEPLPPASGQLPQPLSAARQGSIKFVDKFETPKLEPNRIVAPDSPPPSVETTYQSYPRQTLVKMAAKGDLDAIAELRRSPAGFELPPNVKYLVEPKASLMPFRNYDLGGKLELPGATPEVSGTATSPRVTLAETEAPARVRLGSATQLTPPAERAPLKVAVTPRTESLKTYYAIPQEVRDYVDAQALELQKMPEALRTARMEELKNYGGKGTMLKERLAIEASKDAGTNPPTATAPVSSQARIRELENQERSLLDQSARARTWTKANELTRRAQGISEKIKALKGSAAGSAAD